MKPIQSIQGKMVLLFLLLLIVPLAISLVYVYFRVQNSIEQTYARHQRQTAEALSVDIAKWRRQYEDLSLRIFGDSLVQQVLQEANAPEDARLSGLRSNTRTKLVQYAEYSPYIKAIYVMDNKHRVIGSTDPTAAALAGMLELTSASARLAGSPGWDSGSNDRAVTLYQQIVDNQFDLNRGIGHLFVVLDRAELFNSFQQFTLDAGQQYGMTDKSGRLRITTADDLDTALWAPGLDAGGNSSGGLTGYRLLETAKGTYVYYGIEQDDWLLATWIAEAENLKPVRSTLIVLLIISGALLLYMVVMIVFISDRITKPLRLIHRAMKRIGSGKLQLKVPVLRDDEIGQVGTTLNHMSEEIERLIDKNRIIEKKRRIIQLRTLEYQINPHFLYNTLDSVNMLSRKYDDPRIGDIVTSLSRLFRLGLNQGKETVTVAQELEHVGYYLKIQQIRFADRLSWDCTCDESIGTYRMIKFIMQPLVENSIIHGIRKKNQLGRIRITARGEERHLYFQVSDNGVGMSPLKLEQLRQSLLQEFTEDMERALTDTGFGLWNVDQRIKLHYGKDYGLELESIEGEGTTISVRLPYEEHNRIHEEGRKEGSMSSSYTYQVGVNLGGWLSQREVAQAISGLDTQAHRESFITEEDIQRIAGWGFDHVRLPFDYELLEQEEAPYRYLDEGFEWIDRCLNWCHSMGLGVILDFHRAPGQTYAPEAANPLLHDKDNRSRYLALWEELTRRYHTYREGLIFELLNEVVDNTGYLYKELIVEGLAAIRAIDPQRKVIVGGNQYNSVFALKELPVLDDPQVMYNFHFYEPIPFTHQRAYFAEDMQAYSTTVTYPGTYPELSAFLDKHPEYAAKNRAYVWTVNDRKQMELNLEEARLFMKHTGKPLYCGEFGAIHGTPQASKLAWLSDLTDMLNAYGIGYAYWSYKEMDYGLVDLNGNVLDAEVIQTIVRRGRLA